MGLSRSQPTAGGRSLVAGQLWADDLRSAAVGRWTADDQWSLTQGSRSKVGW